MANLNPYLSFKDNAREALEFYRSVLGGELDITAFGDMGEAMPAAPGEENLVMHGQLVLDDGLMLMAADTPSGMDYVAPTAGVTVAYTGGPGDHDRISAAFAALAEGGAIGVPFEQAPWGDYFGQLTDRFGISWMMDVGTQE